MLKLVIYILIGIAVVVGTLFAFRILGKREDGSVLRRKSQREMVMACGDESLINLYLAAAGDAERDEIAAMAAQLKAAEEGSTPEDATDAEDAANAEDAEDAYAADMASEQHRNPFADQSEEPLADLPRTDAPLFSGFAVDALPPDSPLAIMLAQEQAAKEQAAAEAAEQAAAEAAAEDVRDAVPAHAEDLALSAVEDDGVDLLPTVGDEPAAEEAAPEAEVAPENEPDPLFAVFNRPPAFDSDRPEAIPHVPRLCPCCSAPLEDDAAFCMICGMPVGGEDKAPAETPISPLFMAVADAAAEAPAPAGVAPIETVPMADAPIQDASLKETAVKEASAKVMFDAADDAESRESHIFSPQNRKTCTYCGAAMEQGNSFCIICGMPADENEENEAPVAEPAPVVEPVRRQEINFWGRDMSDKATVGRVPLSMANAAKDEAAAQSKRQTADEILAEVRELERRIMAEVGQDLNLDK